MIDEKQEIVIPEEYRELYENAVLSTGRNFMSAKDVRILIERVAGLIMQAKRDCKSISESKQAFEDLRIADQATLAETLAAALEQSLRAQKAEAERDELLYHTRHASPDDVLWHSPKTVGHLRRQLETLDPNMAIGCCYFVEIQGKNVARTTGVSMSYERVNNERNRIESGNKDIPKGIVIWAHSTDAEGKLNLAIAERDAAIDHYDNMTKQRDAALELAAWKPITPESYPDFGDIVGGMFEGTWKRMVYTSAHASWCPSPLTHYIAVTKMAINAPSIVADGEKP